MIFSQASPVIQGILRTLLLAGFIGLCAQTLHSIHTDVDRRIIRALMRYTALNMLIIYSVSVPFSMLNDGLPFIEIYEYFYRIHLYVFVIFIVVNMIVQIHMYTTLKKWHDNNITPSSITDAMDNFPRGVAFFNLNGVPLFVNSEMDRLYKVITGDAIKNGNTFLDNIKNAQDENGIITCEGKNYIFVTEECEYGKSKVIHVYTTDITDEIIQYNKLSESNEKLSEMQRYLHNMSANINDLTRDEEILDAKARIHDRMGHLLVLSKVYLEKRGGEDRATILSKWRENFTLFTSDNSNMTEEYDSSLRLLYEIRDNYNIKMTVSGEMPLKQSVLRTELYAVSECLSNASKHAKATELQIVNSYKNGRFVAEITNNGTVPDEISEGGGLTNIRKRTEQAGGIMETEITDRFCVRLSFIY